jgi:hypothetical protein
MSVLSQKPTLLQVQTLSALLQKRTRTYSFDHILGALLEFCDTSRPSALAVLRFGHKLEIGRYDDPK